VGIVPENVLNDVRSFIDDDLVYLHGYSLQYEIMKLRNAIRKHRDRQGHDLCWDSSELYALLPEQKVVTPVVPPWCEFMQNCAAYRASLDQPKQRTYPNTTIEECSGCDGCGWYEGSPATICSACKGKGRLKYIWTDSIRYTTEIIHDS
jgi:hypothetical protein